MTPDQKPSESELKQTDEHNRFIFNLSLLYCLAGLITLPCFGFVAMGAANPRSWAAKHIAVLVVAALLLPLSFWSSAVLGNMANVAGNKRAALVAFLLPGIPLLIFAVCDSIARASGQGGL